MPPAKPNRGLRAAAPAKNDHSKQALLALIDLEFSKLQVAIDGLSDAERVEPGAIGEWSVKDVLAHLHVWEKRLLQRVAGKPEDGAGTGTPQFNAAAYLAHKDRALSEVNEMFYATHKRVIALADSLTDAQTAHWWATFRFNTYNHYKWASVHLRRWRKMRAKPQ